MNQYDIIDHVSPEEVADALASYQEEILDRNQIHMSGHKQLIQKFLMQETYLVTWEEPVELVCAYSPHIELFTEMCSHTFVRRMLSLTKLSFQDCINEDDYYLTESLSEIIDLYENAQNLFKNILFTEYYLRYQADRHAMVENRVTNWLDQVRFAHTSHRRVNGLFGYAINSSEKAP